ncbi:MAG: hypothetical protein Q9166_006228 [cf. Caloplaca sp. 2 TL-2023]
MPFCDDDSLLPIKKRKTTITYGSRSMLSRAFQAVKEAVPVGLIPTTSNPLENNAIPTDKVLESPVISVLPAHTHYSGEMSPIEDPLSNTNGISSKAAEDERHNGRGELSSSQRETRAAKRRHAEGHDTATPTRKKGPKYETQVEMQDPQAKSSPRKKANGLTSKRLEYVEEHRDNAGGNNDHDPDDAEPGRSDHDKENRHDSDERPTGRSRRKTRRFSLSNGYTSPTTSTPQKTKTPKTPTSTPARKRGRPRKYPIHTPTPPDVEESELGFRKITTIERPFVHKPVEGRVGTGSTPDTKHSASRKASTRTKQQRGDREDFHESTADILRKTHQVPKAKALEGPLEPPIVHLQQPDDIFDAPMEPQKLDIIHESLNKSTTKLRRVLQTCPAESLALFKSELLNGLLGTRSHLVHMDEEYRRLHQLVTQTVLAGEGNSMLIIGPRGCGKTTLVESVITDLDREHRDQFLVIRLNGFIHTDDKLALREIWRQLGREAAAEDEMTDTRINYADTLTSLLALLAHSSVEEENHDEIARSVVFVIDEFDLFASHPRQTLLYNLFDVAQSRNAPIAVLGLTTRTDVVESLEKRVKSRFGQRYIYLSHPKSFSAFHAICKSALTSREVADGTLSDRLRSEKATVQELRVTWNDHVDALFAHDPQLDQFLRHVFAQSNCLPSFNSAAILPVSLMSSSNIPIGLSFMGSSLLPLDSKLQLLPSLSDLELSLLIAAARLEVILDTNLCSFSMVYDEYVQLASRVKLQSSAAGQTAVGGGARVWGKNVARGAWEKLMDLELVLVASTGARGSDGGSLLCRVDVALEEIGSSAPGLGTTMLKWCKEI